MTRIKTERFEKRKTLTESGVYKAVRRIIFFVFLRKHKTVLLFFGQKILSVVRFVRKIHEAH